jgi:hypothetical protein
LHADLTVVSDVLVITGRPAMMSLIIRVGMFVSFDYWGE